jgi:hypothetical protein
MAWAFIFSAAGSFAYALYCVAHRSDAIGILAFGWGALALRAAIDWARRERPE